MSSLFERLAVNTLSGRPHCRHETAAPKIEGIKRHLELLLNSRRGCSQSCPQLGLLDFNGHELGGGDLLKQVSADIHRTIRRFEPRIKVQALHGVPDAYSPLELHFRLDCQVQVDNHEQQLQIELLINGHNRYTRVR